MFVWACAGLMGPVAHGADRPLHLVFIPKASDQVFWDLMRTGVEEAIRESGNVNLTWRGPAYSGDTDSQIRILEAYTQPGVDAILITASDRERLVEPIRAAADRGIPVIVVDSAVNGDRHRAFITTDNEAAGRQAARQMAALLAKQAQVLVLRTLPGSASTDARGRGFVDELKRRAPTVTIVADVYGGGSPGKLRSQASDLLRQWPQVDGIFTVNESSTDGMLRAVRSAGRAGQVKFIGFDATPFLLDGLANGELDALVIQNPRKMGYLAVKAALDLIHQRPRNPATIYTETHLVTRLNARQPDIQRLMCVQC